MIRRETFFTRSFEPLVGSLWPLFIIWTVVAACLWTSGIGEQEIRNSVANPGFRDALVVIVNAADTIWLILATTNLYLALAERIGLGDARLWTLAILATATVVAAASVRTGWPIGGRALATRLLPRASHLQIAAATGALALLTAINLEPLASKVRFFWFWYVPGAHVAGQAPWRNYITWWLVATALAFFLRERKVVATPHPSSTRPALVLILFNAVFLVAHLALAIRR